MQTHICGHKNAIATIKSGCTEEERATRGSWREEARLGKAVASGACQGSVRPVQTQAAHAVLVAGSYTVKAVQTQDWCTGAAGTCWQGKLAGG